MSKCSEYWSSSHRPKSAETVASVLGRQLPTPCVTRWSSLYHALVAFLDNKAQLRTLSEKLDLTTFRDVELEFLEEYRDILYPIATAINILQKSANGYYGELLPTLTTVQKKLNAIQPKTRTSAVILDSVREGLHKRFGTFLKMENEEALIATCSHPFFKLRWTSKEDGRASNLEDLLAQKANAAQGQVTNWDEILKAHTKEIRRNPVFAGAELPVPVDTTASERTSMCTPSMKRGALLPRLGGWGPEGCLQNLRDFFTIFFEHNPFYGDNAGTLESLEEFFLTSVKEVVFREDSTDGVQCADSRLREAGAEVVYCLARGAPKGPNLPRARLNHQDALFPGHGKATHSQTWAGEPAWLGVRGDATLQTPAFTEIHGRVFPSGLERGHLGKQVFGKWYHHGPRPMRVHLPTSDVRGFPVSEERGILVVETSPGTMLLRMKKQMEGRLGIQVEKTDSKTLLTGVKAFLKSKGKVAPPVPLTKRNNLDIKGHVPDGATSRASTETGAYLFTTSIMQLRARRDPQIDTLLQEFGAHFTALATAQDTPEAVQTHAKLMLGYMSCWSEEAELVAALSGGGTGFFQQGSGIDVVFSTYFWLYKLNCRSYATFGELNGLLVGISQNPQGKTKTLKIMSAMGTPLATNLVRIMSKSADIHLPPFVLNPSRLYDLVTAFGAFPLDDVKCEALEGFSCSPRYVLNLRRDGGEGLTLIGVSWDLWFNSYAGGPPETEISESEHLFHQFLLTKRSPFQKTHQLQGNALNVEIVASQNAMFEGLDPYVRALRAGQQEQPEDARRPLPGAGRGQRVPSRP
ncbi:hypothetical protein ISCGN_005671 [Ixodes scapularis]